MGEGVKKGLQWTCQHLIEWELLQHAFMRDYSQPEQQGRHLHYTPCVKGDPSHACLIPTRGRFLTIGRASRLHPCSPQVLLLSTGVIGRRIKLGALVASLPALVAGLGASAEDAHHAAVAVTTTDLVSKSAALEARCAQLACDGSTASWLYRAAVASC